MENTGKSTVTLPKQFENLTGMGIPVEVYSGKTALALNIILSALLFLGGGGALIYALYILWMRWGRYYPPVIFKAVLPWLIGALIAFVVAVLFLWGIYTRRKKAVVIYSNGFAYSDRKKVVAWHWDQVKDVTANVIRHYTNGIPSGTTHQYTLVHNNGDKLVINDQIKGIENVFTHVQNNTLQRRYQQLANEFNSGGPVSFGSVSIGKETGIQIGKKVYPWDEVEEVAINKGMLSVKKKDGGWFSGASATAGTIPNLHVLLSILNQIVGLKTGQ